MARIKYYNSVTGNWEYADASYGGYVLTESDKAEIAEMVLESLGGHTVFGYVDENNNIIVSGNLTGGTYSVKYELEDGSTVDIGDLVLDTEVEPEPTYTNLLPLAVDASGNDYKGANGEDGYNPGYKISVSSAAESAASGASVTGFMPVNGGQKIRIKNITVSSAASVNNIVFYNADKTKNNGYAGTAGAFHASVKVDGDVYLVNLDSWYTAENRPAFFRFSCGGITADTVVTVDEEIL